MPPENLLDSPGSSDSRSSLDVADDAFTVMIQGPRPLELNLAGIPRLRATDGSLPAVRILLARPDLPGEVLDGIWGRILGRRPAREWTVAAVGLMMPALRHVSRTFGPVFSGESEDLDGEVLAGFLAGFRRAVPSERPLGFRLAAAGYLAGLAATVLAPRGGAEIPVFAAVPPAPWGNPRALLDAAYRMGVVTPPETSMLYATRLRGQTLAQVAPRFGIPAEELALLRAEAEARLVKLLLAGRITVWGGR